MESVGLTITQQGGLFGALFLLITVPLAIYARWLSRELRTTQDARVAEQTARIAEAKEVRETLLAVTNEFSGALREQVRTSAEVKGVFERTVATLERVERRIEVLEDTVQTHVRPATAATGGPPP